MQPQDILQALYESEINCRVESFWDGGWIGWLGDEMNGFPFARVRGSTLTECVKNLGNKRVRFFPRVPLQARFAADDARLEAETPIN